MEVLKKIWAQKMKFVIFIVATITLTIYMFPFGDLSDWLSSMVAENTDNTVYVQFDDMGLALNPAPALKMTNVVAETPFASDIAVDELYISPSLLAAIKQKPFGNITANGLFGGALDADISSSSKIKDPEAIYANIEFNDFQMKELIKALQLSVPISVSGQGRLLASVDLDPSMKVQPNGDIDLTIDSAVIPSFSLPLGAMSLPLPEISLERLAVKGNLNNGQLTLKETTIGSSKDELSARIKGTVDLRVFPGGSPTIGLYNLEINLNIKNSAEAKFGGMTSMVDMVLGKFRSAKNNSKQYDFRIQARGLNDPNPTLSPL